MLMVLARTAGSSLLLASLTAADMDLLSFGVGAFDVDPALLNLAAWYGTEQDSPADRRASAWLIELRPAAALVSREGSDGWAVRGLYGLAVTDDMSGFLHGSGWLDGAWGPIVAGISFGPGIWLQGNGKDLGSLLQFRSMAEVGWRSTSGFRATLSVSHISNAGLAEVNPGANLIAIQAHFTL